LPSFIYSATDKSGRKIEGALDAKDEAGALARVRGMDYLPIRIQRKKDTLFLSGRLGLLRKVGDREILNFTQEMSTLVKAGLPLDKCLSILVELTRKKNIGKIVEDIQKNVHGGSSFAEALARHPRIFSRLYVNMVKAGETGECWIPYWSASRVFWNSPRGFGTMFAPPWSISSC